MSYDPYKIFLRFSKGHNSKNKKGGTFLYSFSYHEDILKIATDGRTHGRKDGRAGGQCHTIMRLFLQNGRKTGKTWDF